MGIVLSAFRMVLEITVFLDSKYSKSETFTMNITGNIVTHKGRGRKRILKEVEDRFPNWFSVDIKRIENQEFKQ